MGYGSIKHVLLLMSFIIDKMCYQKPITSLLVLLVLLFELYSDQLQDNVCCLFLKLYSILLEFYSSSLKVLSLSIVIQVTNEY